MAGFAGSGMHVGTGSMKLGMMTLPDLSLWQLGLRQGGPVAARRTNRRCADRASQPAGPPGARYQLLASDCKDERTIVTVRHI